MMRGLIITLSGWLFASGLLVWHFTFDQGTKAAFECGPEQEAFAPTSELPDLPGRKQAALTRVYIKPHPPGWIQGRTVEFERFERFSRDGRGMIRFFTRTGAIEVPPDSVDWQGGND